MAPSSPADEVTRLRVGNHVCCIYESEEEHQALLAPFLAQGLERGEKVLYLADAHLAATILEYLRQLGLSPDDYLASGQLGIRSARDTYLCDGVFDPDRMISLLRSETELALNEGHAGLRVTGEMTWALAGAEGSKRLIEYEAKLNRFFPGSQSLAICQYDRRRFDAQTLVDVISTHPTVVIGTQFYDNFYYTPPEDFLRRDVPGLTLRHWLENLAARKRAEEVLRKSEASLAEAQRSTHLGNWDWDIANDAPWWSEEMYRIFGFSPQAFVPTLEAGLSCVHPADRERVREAMHQAIHDGKPYNLDYRIVRPDGSERVVHAQGDVFFDETATPVRMAGTVQDITERARAEEEIRKLNEELEARVRARTAELEATNQELEAFTYSVSHDLRAPLRHIDGFSKLLLDECQAGLAETAQGYLNRIREATRQMGQLVDDLLNLSRLGRRELSLRLTGLNSLVEEVRHELKSEVGKREVEWRIGSLPFVECDPALMKQVLSNLLSNAVKFTRPRERAVIEVGSLTQDGQPVIFVRDNGVGFSMKYADKLYGIFQRLHRQEDFEGTGVGLATVQRIIQKHGGRVWAEAKLNQGATFYVALGAPDVGQIQRNQRRGENEA